MVGVAAAALLLVVLQRDVGRPRAADRHLPHELETKHGVAHDLSELAGAQLAWLVQDALVHVHLADVVQQTTQCQVLQVLVAERQLAAEHHPVKSNVDGVLEGVVVVALERRDALEDLRVEDLVEQVLHVSFESADLTLYRAAQLGRHLGEHVRALFGRRVARPFGRLGHELEHAVEVAHRRRTQAL